MLEVDHSPRMVAPRIVIRRKPGGLRGTLCEFFNRVFPARPHGGNGIPPYKAAPAAKQYRFYDGKGSVNESHKAGMESRPTKLQRQ